MACFRGGIRSGIQGDSSRGGRGRGDSSRGGHSGGRGRVDSSRVSRSGGRGLVPPQGDRGAFGSSSSRGGSGDPMADMHETLREQRSRVISSYGSDHYSEDANYGDSDHEVGDHEGDTNHSSQHNSHVGDALRNTSHGRLIKRSGEGFVNVHGNVHKSISRILREHRDGAWLTFKQVPRDEVAHPLDVGSNKRRSNL